MTDQPAWAIPDDVVSALPLTGWVKDYLAYGAYCTDAPLAYHLGVGFTVLAAAAANVDVRIYRPDDGLKSEVPLHLWSVLVADTGDRKSQAMDLGIDILRVARKMAGAPRFLLPNDGSLEAWHDFMAESPNVLLYRDEIATLFDQSRRGYSEGMKHWLIERGHGKELERTTKAKGKESVVVERPRICILGGIPPDTFRAKSGKGDWRSGFLTRFSFWPGRRTRYMSTPVTDAKTEKILATWVANVAYRSRGYLAIVQEGTTVISDWVLRTVERMREDYPPEVFGHLLRYQDLAYRLSGMIALGEQIKAQIAPAGVVVVRKCHTEAAVEVIEALRPAAMALFGELAREAERGEEQEIIEVLRQCRRPLTSRELSGILSNWSYRRLRITLEALVNVGVLQKVKTKAGRIGAGRMMGAYVLPPE